MAPSRCVRAPQWVLGILSICLCCGWIVPRAAHATPSKRPKLLVVLVVDQMRADYVARYGHHWRGGLARLFRSGARFENTAYPYLQTVTCAGHATIGTGAYPHKHGMVLNAWWDRKARAMRACTHDDQAHTIDQSGATVAGGHSGTALRLPTLADEMRAQLWPAPKVVSLSLKARAALMLAGRRADALVWFEGRQAVTSDRLGDSNKEGFTSLVGRHPAPVLAPWRRLLPVDRYLFEDASPFEAAPAPWTSSFPHEAGSEIARIGATDQSLLWALTPDADDHLLTLAEKAISDLKLGQGKQVDYLAVSLSTLDLVGHAFGPQSHEVQDVLVRLDRRLGQFLNRLDSLVGQGRYTVALTSDHGVAPLPEVTRRAGLDAGRIDPTKIAHAVDRALTQTLGRGRVDKISYSDIYLAPADVARALARREDARRAVLDAIEQQPGVDTAFLALDLKDGASGGPPGRADRVRRAAALGIYPGRSGDLIFAPRPHFITAAQGTTHGSAADYDRKVPFVLFGAGIKPGRYTDSTSPADLAPSLAQLVGVTLPFAEGQARFEALR